MKRWLFYVCLAAATGAISAGYGLLTNSSFWIWICFPVSIGLLWLLGWLRAMSWLASFCLVLFSLAAALEILLGAPAYLSLVGFLAALLAWDLQYFYQRFGEGKLSEPRRNLERNHLQRLSILSVASLVVGSLGLVIHFRLGLGLAIFFALLAGFGLYWALLILRNRLD